MKAWIGSQDLMRDHSIWVFWDWEWRQAWRPAVGLTAGTRVHGDGRLGAQKDVVTRVGRNPVSQPLCTAFPESLCFQLTRFLSWFYQTRPGRDRNLDTSNDRGGVITSYFLIIVPKHSWFYLHELSMSEGFEQCPTFLILDFIEHKGMKHKGSIEMCTFACQ